MSTTPKTEPKSDFQIQNHGSIVLIRPLSEACLRWLNEHVQDGSLWWGGALAVEPRYVAALIEGLECEGGFTR